MHMFSFSFSHLFLSYAHTHHPQAADAHARGQQEEISGLQTQLEVLKRSSQSQHLRAQVYIALQRVLQCVLQCVL